MVDHHRVSVGLSGRVELLWDWLEVEGLHAGALLQYRHSADWVEEIGAGREQCWLQRDDVTKVVRAVGRAAVAVVLVGVPDPLVNRQMGLSRADYRQLLLLLVRRVPPSIKRVV